MKIFHFITALILTTLLTVSCVESSNKYKNALSYIDSLQAENIILENEYQQTLSILDEIENGFAAIRESEGKLMVDLSDKEENSSQSKKEQIANQIQMIKDMLADNRSKIAQLQAKANENSSLKKSIARLEQQLQENSAIISSLEQELAKKEKIIQDLTLTIDMMALDIDELNNLSAEQTEILMQQDSFINTAWCCVATKKELKAAGIITRDGLIAPKRVLGKSFDQDAFVQVDIRDLTEIITSGKKINILTSHPQDSYNVVFGEDKNAIIKIISPDKFWSISKYLVVQQ